MRSGVAGICRPPRAPSPARSDLHLGGQVSQDSRRHQTRPAAHRAKIAPRLESLGPQTCQFDARYIQRLPPMLGRVVPESADLIRLENLGAVRLSKNRVRLDCERSATGIREIEHTPVFECLHDDVAVHISSKANLNPVRRRGTCCNELTIQTPRSLATTRASVAPCMPTGTFGACRCTADSPEPRDVFRSRSPRWPCLPPRPPCTRRTPPRRTHRARDRRQAPLRRLAKIPRPTIAPQPTRLVPEQIASARKRGVPSARDS